MFNMHINLFIYWECVTVDKVLWTKLIRIKESSVNAPYGLRQWTINIKGDGEAEQIHRNTQLVIKIAYFGQQYRTPSVYS